MKKIIHNYSGLSLLELLEKHGTGAKGFYDISWWHDEAFAKEKPPKGKYEIDISKDLVNLPFAEQQKKLAKGFEVVHPAILAEALITYYLENGEYTVTDYWLRTSSLDSDGARVLVGYCDAGGVFISYYWGVFRVGVVGVGACRKSDKKLETGNLDSLEFSSLELRVSALENWRDKITNAAGKALDEIQP